GRGQAKAGPQLIRKKRCEWCDEQGRGARHLPPVISRKESLLARGTSYERPQRCDRNVEAETAEGTRHLVDGIRDPEVVRGRCFGCRRGPEYLTYPFEEPRHCA